MGRPRKEIDGEEVRKLASIGCTMEEIGEYFGCDKSLICRRFATEFELGKSSCKTSVRRWQMKKGRAGCTSMLIHLGGVYLGQSTKVDVTNRRETVYVPRAQNPRDRNRITAHANGDSNGNGMGTTPEAMGTD